MRPINDSSSSQVINILSIIANNIFLNENPSGIAGAVVGGRQHRKITGHIIGINTIGLEEVKVDCEYNKYLMALA